MASSAVNDMPTFQAVDNTTENTVFSPSIPAQVCTSESTTLVESTPMETSAIATTNASTSSLHSILTNGGSSSSSSASVPVTSASHSHPPTSVNHTPKVSASISQSIPVNNDQILTKTRLQDLVKEIDPCEQLDEEVEDLLLQLVDDFVNTTVNTACIFAKHRNASTVEVKDVQLYLEKMYQMWIPGFGTEEVKPYKKPPITEAHKQRLALIRKSLKKY